MHTKINRVHYNQEIIHGFLFHKYKYDKLYHNLKDKPNKLYEYFENQVDFLLYKINKEEFHQFHSLQYPLIINQFFGIIASLVTDSIYLGGSS